MKCLLTRITLCQVKIYFRYSKIFICLNFWNDFKMNILLNAHFFRNQGRNEEATQVLQRALQNIEHKSPLEKGIEVVRNLVKQSPSTEAYKVHFALLQRACLQVDQPPRARQCANIIIPELQSLAEWFKQRGF